MLDSIEWFLVFICIDLFFIISCLYVDRKLDEIIDKLDKIEKDRSNYHFLTKIMWWYGIKFVTLHQK